MKKALLVIITLAAIATQFYPDYSKPSESKAPYSLNVEANATLTEILDR